MNKVKTLAEHRAEVRRIVACKINRFVRSDIDRSTNTDEMHALRIKHNLDSWYEKLRESA